KLGLCSKSAAKRVPVPKRAPTAARATAAATLTELLDRGQRLGSLQASEIEASLLAHPPDAAEFSLFLDLTSTLGIVIRETPEPEVLPVKSMDALGIYFRDVSRYPLLTPEEERVYGRRSRRGDEKARERMVRSNLRLVVSIARRYTGRGVDLEDIIEDGNLGLITAVERFDPEKGFRFSTYAAWWIRQAIATGVAEQSRTLRIPLHVMRALHRYLEQERRLALELERRPDPEEICKAAGFGPRRGSRVVALLHGIRSLDEEVAGDASQHLSLLDRLPAAPSLEEVIFRQLEHAHLEQVLQQQCSEKEVLVLRIRYGFMDGRPRSLTQTGLFLGVSRERIRQIEKRALRRLREWIEREERETERLRQKTGAGAWN
ncbi:MAG: RNA polymerase sigma factor RpoD/SigA, partial [Candidatus Eisenbacteria bacterium]